MVGESDAIRDLLTAVQAVAPFACTVLIRGESGTGKELVAREIHQCSCRAAGPFVAVDCTTLRDTLLESQLFGHVKGAFTGADRENLGFVRSAEAGTLFLDEIGELPLAAQAKLLRCIQERCVVPVGGTRPVPIDVRIVAATHRDLRQMVKDGAFRQDLYFRLHVVQILTPPLRDRASDVLILARHFLDDLARLYSGPRCTLDESAAAALLAHPWPGNVRELANAMEHAFVFKGERTVLSIGCLPADLRPAPGPIEILIDVATIKHGPRSAAAPSDFQSEIARKPQFGVGPRVESPAEDVPERITWAEMERRTIRAALLESQGNISAAARSLELERRRLTRLIDEHGLRSMTTV